MSPALPRFGGILLGAPCLALTSRGRCSPTEHAAEAPTWSPKPQEQLGAGNRSHGSPPSPPTLGDDRRLDSPPHPRRSCTRLCAPETSGAALWGGGASASSPGGSAPLGRQNPTRLHPP